MAEMKNLTINGEQFVLPFAPAGYGLGGASIQQSAATWNGCGFFRFENGTPDNKTVMGYQVDLWGDGSIRELYGVCVSDTYKSRLHRTDFNGVPGEWEWENPPMVLGVEYRTTKRDNGRAVYTKAVSCGKGPSGGAANLPTAVNGNVEFVSLNCKAVSDAGWGLFLNQYLSFGENGSGGTSVSISGAGDLSSRNLYLTMEYVKV